MYGLVYRVTHAASGRVYVGQTVQRLAKRWRDHQRESYCIRLSRAITKYGAAAFTVKPVCHASSKLQLDMLERFWISVHQATDPAQGFNLRDGGSFGKHSDASRAKMSARVRAALAGPDYRAKLSLAKQGRVPSEETKRRIAASNTGKRHTEATLAVLSERRRAYWRDSTTHDELVAKQTALKQQPEARAAAAAKSRAQWADPEQRKKLLEAQAAGKARARAARQGG